MHRQANNRARYWLLTARRERMNHGLPPEGRALRQHGPSHRVGPDSPTIGHAACRLRWRWFFAPGRKAVVMFGDAPSGLLYVLTVGREKELVLRIHGTAPSTQDLFAWMRDAAVRS
jgi:hypothetical protein